MLNLGSVNICNNIPQTFFATYFITENVITRLKHIEDKTRNCFVFNVKVQVEFKEQVSLENTLFPNYCMICKK